MYGDLLDKYPVVPGSGWEFGSGFLVCGSNQKRDIQDFIPMVEGVYTDPPWSLGNMKMFYKFAGRLPNVEFYEFIDNIFNMIKRKTGPGSVVCFDMGMKHGNEVIERLEAKGWQTTFKSVTYYGKPARPCYTIGGSFYITHEMASVDGLHGEAVISAVVRNILQAGAGSLFDPCCGKLDFLTEGLKQGVRQVYGIELIPEKLALGLQRLEKLGYKVRRVA